MNWKYILHARSGRTLHEIAKIARSIGYRFLSFNGLLYFVDGEGHPHDTGLRTDEVVGEPEDV